MGVKERKNRRSFVRQKAFRPYKKLFVLAMEGDKTEPRYFEMFKNPDAVIRLKLLNNQQDSSPARILSHMEKYLRQEGLKESDEAWIIVDRDQWREDSLAKLYEWSRTADNRGLALSNPNFEYWLLLHFEDGNDIRDPRQCLVRLKSHIPQYDKEINLRKINQSHIEKAIQRAKVRDNPPCVDWPRSTGMTTVYRLVEKLLANTGDRETFSGAPVRSPKS